ncbi:MAG: hypothetical protein K5888_05970 [Lachnospiraceae bacterium]|nr:hypothetical protein [Lachnospiraceae bacterium]
MKRSLKCFCRITLLIALVFAISFSGMFGLKAEARSKKKAAITEEEQHVIDLIAYRDMLIKQGASQEDIDFANRAIELATVEAEQAKAAAEAQKQAAEAQKAYEAQVKAMQKSSKNATAFPFIFVGDSRMVQMHAALGNTGVLYIAENAKGYDWFVEKAIPQIDSACGKGSRIVINLGVNDPGNADKYIAMVNAKTIEWTAKGAKVYYATVNPVWDNPYTSEDQVVTMNNKLINGLVGVQIIDTHTYLVNNGYRLIDGLHYDGPTYASLYSFILNKIM